MKQLAAIHALGALDGEDAGAFSALLGESETARREFFSFSGVSEALARSLPAPLPSPDLKDRILRQAKQLRAKTQAETRLKALVPASQNGLGFLKQAGESGWVPLRVPGASVKLLSYDEKNDYAIVLGKLEPGSRYPAHQHQHPEDLFMLSGDLHIGEEVIRTGDFHHAEEHSHHGVNWSETGCVLIAVLSKEDLLNQLASV